MQFLYMLIGALNIVQLHVYYIIIGHIVLFTIKIKTNLRCSNLMYIIHCIVQDDYTDMWGDSCPPILFPEP